MKKRAKIKVVTYGGAIGWFLRRHFSWITSDLYLSYQYFVRKKLYLEFMRTFDSLAAQGEYIQPCIISIETINRCNSKCSFCPASIGNDTRPFMKMDENTFKKIIDDLKVINYSGYLNLYVNNEPFIDTRIEDWYIYAKKELPNAKMLLYTNGTLLSKERFEKIIPVVDKMVINNYSKDLDIHNNIKEIISLVKSNSNYFEKDITVQLRYIDEILTNRAGAAPNKTKKMLRNMECIMPYTDIIIYPDGTYGLCCCDAKEVTNLGNAIDKDIWDEWTGKRYKGLRETIGRNRLNYSFCAGCDFVDAGIRNEYMLSWVNGRR